MFLSLSLINFLTESVNGIDRLSENGEQWTDGPKPKDNQFPVTENELQIDWLLN